MCDCGCLSERKKRGESQSVKVSCGFFRELQLDLCFWFSTLSSLSLNHCPPNHPSFPPLNNNSPHTPHEDAGNAVNDNTLALFLFTTPHHHFTRPSLPSHSPHHSSSLLTHRVQPTAHGVTNDVMQTLQLLHPCCAFLTQFLP